MSSFPTIPPAAQILEARKLLTAGHSVSTVSQWISLSSQLVSRLAQEIYDERVITVAELTRVSPVFQFDSAYREVVCRYFSQPRELCKALTKVENAEQFVLCLHRMVTGHVERGNIYHEPLPIPPFLRDVVALPGGRSLSFPVAAVIRDAVSRQLTCPTNLRDWATVASCIDCMVPPSPPHFVFESSVIMDRPPSQSLPPSDGRAEPITPQARKLQQLRLIQLNHARFRRKARTGSNHQKGALLANKRWQKAATAMRKHEDDLNEVLKAFPSPATANSLHRTFVDILNRRVDVNQQGSQVDPLLLRVAMVLRSYSFTGYEFLQRYLPFPDITTIYRHYEPRIKTQEVRLSTVAEIPSIVEARKRFSFATIAVDAISLDSVFLSKREGKFTKPQPTHAFVYECLPLMTEEQCFPLHVKAAMSGNAKQDQIKVAKDIVEVLAKLKPPVHVLFVATDGDKGYNSVYQSQFNLWFPCYRKQGLTECLKIVGSLAPFFIGDWLHLSKNVRGRILKYIPVLRYLRREFEVKWQVMDELLHLGPVFSDLTSAGKMRDCYPIALFQLTHVITLFCNERCAEAVYLLPWAFGMICFRSAGIAKVTRVFLLEITLGLFCKLYVDCTEGGHGLNEQGKAGIRVLPLKRITLLRVMATVAGVLYALVVIDGDIPLDRISTHPLENIFGLLRRLLHDCNTFEELLRGAARNSIVNELYHELGHPKHVCGRENQGGVVCSLDGHTLAHPGFTAQEAVEQIWATLQITERGFTPFTDEAYARLGKVLAWLEDIEEACSTRSSKRAGCFTLRATANSKIMASLLQRRTTRKR
jgi:hypothetical protein